MIERRNMLASGSADSVKLWKLNYMEKDEVPKNEEEFSMKPSLKNPLLKASCIRSFSHNGLVFSITTPINNPNLLIIGGRNGILKYYDLKSDTIIFE